jgi:HlyD family secretion protein
VKTLARKLLLWGLGLVVAGLVVYGLLPAPVEVETAQVSRGLLQITVDEDGKTRIKERYIVSAPLAGKLRRIELHPGDSVVAGKTLLGVIEPEDPGLLDVRTRTTAEARVKAAEANKKRAMSGIDRAREAYDLAQHEYERTQALWQRQSISRQEFDNAEHKARITREELRVAEFAAVVAEFELDQARATLLFIQPKPKTPSGGREWHFDIRSPISGQVLHVFQESATVVTPGTRLLELGDPTDLEAEIDVLSTEAVKIRPGARVLFDRWGGDQVVEGRVRLVEPAAFLKVSALGIEEQRVYVIADFTDPPEKYRRLGDAYRVEARIVIWENDDVLKVPAGALFHQGDGWAVFRIAGNRARACPVHIGKNNGLEAEVLEGLNEGDRVILHPSDKVKDGAAVVERVR